MVSVHFPGSDSSLTGFSARFATFDLICAFTHFHLILFPPSVMINMNGSSGSNGPTTLLSRIEINVDCGEAFGLWEGGPDEELMPMIDAANVACGGHAGDPVIMQRTVALAKKNGIKVGARKSGNLMSCRRYHGLNGRPGFPGQSWLRKKDARYELRTGLR